MVRGTPAAGLARPKRQAECAWPAGERKACRTPHKASAGRTPAKQSPRSPGVPAAPGASGPWGGKGNFASPLREGKLPLPTIERGAGGAGVSSASARDAHRVGNATLRTPGCRQCHIAYLRARCWWCRCGRSDGCGRAAEGRQVIRAQRGVGNEPFTTSDPGLVPTWRPLVSC